MIKSSQIVRVYCGLTCLSILLFVFTTSYGLHDWGGVSAIAFWLLIAARTRQGEFAKNFTFPVR